MLCMVTYVHTGVCPVVNFTEQPCKLYVVKNEKFCSMMDYIDGTHR